MGFLINMMVFIDTANTACYSSHVSRGLWNIYATNWQEGLNYATTSSVFTNIECYFSV